jgi:hypothetical protein
MVGPLALTTNFLAAVEWSEHCELIEALKRMGLVCQKLAMVSGAVG